MTDEDGTILERYRYRVYGEHKVINSCHTLCDTTYQSCFDACNENTACEDGCLATKNSCDNTTCAASDYAGNVHNFLWGGSLYEPESDLYWMRNRYYHIGMHRFINQDPIGIWGDANNLGNGFAYVAGMVIEASDPTGLASDDDNHITVTGNRKQQSVDFDDLVIDVKTKKPEEEEEEESEEAPMPDFSWMTGNVAQGGLDSFFQYSEDKVPEYLAKQGFIDSGKVLGRGLGGAHAFLQFSRAFSKGDEQGMVFALGSIPIIFMTGPVGWIAAGGYGLSTGFLSDLKNVALKADERMAKQRNISNQEARIEIESFLKSSGGDPTKTTAWNQVHRNVWIYTINIMIGNSIVQGVFAGKNVDGKLSGVFESNDRSIAGRASLSFSGEINGNYSGSVGDANIETSGPAFIPYDPDSMNKVQSYFLNNIMRKMLKIGTNEEEKEVILVKIEDNIGFSGSQWVMVRNPFYKPVDPPVFITGSKDPNGRIKMFRNPFVPPVAQSVFNNMAEALFNSDFNPGNIDPVLQ